MGMLDDAIHVLHQFRDAVQGVMKEDEIDSLDYLVWDEHINDKLVYFDLPSITPWYQFHAETDGTTVTVTHYLDPSTVILTVDSSADEVFDTLWDAASNEDWDALYEAIHDQYPIIYQQYWQG